MAIYKENFMAEKFNENSQKPEKPKQLKRNRKICDRIRNMSKEFEIKRNNETEQKVSISINKIAIEHPI
jgi:hypothetical protein